MAGRAKKKLEKVTPLSLAREKCGQKSVFFANEVFFTARVLRMSFDGREFFVGMRPCEDVPHAGFVTLKIGSQLLQIALTNLSECASLNERLATLAFEMYPDTIKQHLLEILLEPFLTSLEAWAGVPVTVQNLNFRKNSQLAKALTMRCMFTLYDGNPFEGKDVPALLHGTLAAGTELAERFLVSLRAIPRVPYRFYGCAIPPCRNVVSTLRMPTEEVRSLRAGDVILLEDTGGIIDGGRTLIGISPYAIECTQDGAQMTVCKLRKASETAIL
ncbi:MAG: hypothetical protein LBC42_02680 [Puniceicoccales bacterium]|jgi:hypothetical protein|nr:hypothetical protein [Puniceicoccales bacterium]